MKLVLFICLVGICLVAAEKEVGDKHYPFCGNVDCNNCFFTLDDCYYCCKDFPVDCMLIDCRTCDFKYCGHCCDFNP